MSAYVNITLSLQEYEEQKKKI